MSLDSAASGAVAGRFAVGEPAPRPLGAPTEATLIAGWGGIVAPVVSVVCLCHNHVDFLADALHGIFGQRTTFPFEVIVWDDASTDGSRELLQDFAMRYPTLLRPLTPETNQRRLGRRPGEVLWPLLRGRYIALCEADDYWLDPAKLALQVEYLEQHPATVLCSHDCVIAAEGRIKQQHAVPAAYRRALSATQLIRGQISFATSTLLFRNVLRSWPPEQSMVRNGDYFLVCRLGEYGGMAYLDQLQPSVYRHHRQGIFSSLAPSAQAAIHLETCYLLALYRPG